MILVSNYDYNFAMFSKQSTLQQLVQLVDESDMPVGFTDVLSAHQGDGLLHRAISVFLFRKSPVGIELLVQQRSTQKLVAPMQWANTVCGHVRPDETYRQCAVRRLKEELGTEIASLHELIKFTYQVRCNSELGEHEMDTLFAGWFDGECEVNSAEVHQTDWVQWTPQLVLNRDKTWTPWFDHFMADEIIQQSLRQFTDQNSSQVYEKEKYESG